MDRKELYILVAGVSFLTFSLTRNYYIIKSKVTLLENNLTNIKERLSDLELFKLKVYNNEISIGRRAWEDDMEDEEVNLDIDID